MPSQPAYQQCPDPPLWPTWPETTRASLAPCPSAQPNYARPTRGTCSHTTPSLHAMRTLQPPQLPLFRHIPRPPQVALPGLDPAGACSSPGPQGPSAPSHGSPTAQQPIEATSRRLREALTKPYQPHDADIPCLLGKLSSDAKDPESAREALGKLWQLTVMTRANRAANQAAVAAEGGVAAVVEVATARLAAWEQGGADGDADSVIMALLVGVLACVMGSAMVAKRCAHGAAVGPLRDAASATGSAHSLVSKGTHHQDAERSKDLCDRHWYVPFSGAQGT